MDLQADRRPLLHRVRASVAPRRGTIRVAPATPAPAQIARAMTEAHDHHEASAIAPGRDPWQQAT